MTEQIPPQKVVKQEGAKPERGSWILSLPPKEADEILHEIALIGSVDLLFRVLRLRIPISDNQQEPESKTNPQE